MFTLYTGKLNVLHVYVLQQDHVEFLRQFLNYLLTKQTRHGVIIFHRIRSQHETRSFRTCPRSNSSLKSKFCNAASDWLFEMSIKQASKRVIPSQFFISRNGLIPNNTVIVCARNPLLLTLAARTFLHSGLDLGLTESRGSHFICDILFLLI